MKKIMALSATLLAAVMILTSCAGSNRDPERPNFLEEPYTFVADFTMDDLSGRLRFNHYGSQEFMLEFLAPESIAGMTVHIQSDTYVLSYRGIRQEGPLADLGNAHPAFALRQILSGEKKPTKTTADVYEFEDGAKILIDGNAPVTIKAPACRLSLTITEFKLLTES